MKILTVRDACVALIAVTATCAALAATSQAKPILPSTVFDWNAIEVRETKVGSSRQVVRAPTATLDELEMLVDGEWKKLGVGSIIFQASNQLHAIRNVGTGPTTYHVINWSSPGMLKKQ